MTNISTIIQTNNDQDESIIEPYILNPTTNNPDIYLINHDSIKIQDIRFIQAYIREKPRHSPQKQVFIFQAHHLTTPAKHAILKILEEPPSYARIFLITSKPYQLLDTILSRCLLTPNHSLKETESKTNKSNLDSLLDQLQSNNFNKKTALDITQNILFHTRNLLRSQPNHHHAQFAKQVTDSYYRIQHNAHPQLTLETIVESSKNNLTLHPNKK